MYQIIYQGGAEVQVKGNMARVVGRGNVIVLNWTTLDAAFAYADRVYGKKIW